MTVLSEGRLLAMWPSQDGGGALLPWGGQAAGPSRWVLRVAILGRAAAHGWCTFLCLCDKFPHVARRLMCASLLARPVSRSGSARTPRRSEAACDGCFLEGWDLGMIFFPQDPFGKP